MTWTPDICIYHDNCDDGFAAALVVHKQWGDFVEYRATNYKQPVPDEDIDGQNVLIADFSFPADTLVDMAKYAKSIVVLDHHETAREELDFMAIEDLGMNHEKAATLFFEEAPRNLIVLFDMDRSGARMTWDFFHPGEPAPLLIQYIQDRDLWLKEMPHSDDVTFWIRSFPRKFGNWTFMLETMEKSGIDSVLEQAATIRRFNDLRVSNIADTAVIRPFDSHGCVAVVHCPYDFVSDVGHELLDRHTNIHFAVMIVEAYGRRTYSMRSRDDRLSVSEVAKRYGGGGHRNAAGFSVPL